MNPSNNNSGMELPPPTEQSPVQFEQAPAENLPSQNPEITPGISHEAAQSPSQASPMPIPMTVPLPQAPATPITQDASTIQDDKKATDSKLIQDKDLIEKEWVTKAKAIVERTRDDPYKQSEDLTNLKADYMKREFNKTIKLNN
jgi:hypothetical protein